MWSDRVDSKENEYTFKVNLKDETVQAQGTHKDPLTFNKGWLVYVISSAIFTVIRILCMEEMAH